LDGDAVFFPPPAPTSDIAIRNITPRSPAIDTSAMSTEQSEFYAYSQYLYDRTTVVVEFHVDVQQSSAFWDVVQRIRGGDRSFAAPAAVEVLPDTCARIRQAVGDFTTEEVARQSQLTQQIQHLQQQQQQQQQQEQEARSAASSSYDSASWRRAEPSESSPHPAASDYSFRDFVGGSSSNYNYDNDNDDDKHYPQKPDIELGTLKGSHLLDEEPPASTTTTSSAAPPAYTRHQHQQVRVGVKTRRQKRDEMAAFLSSVIVTGCMILLLGCAFALFWGVGLIGVAIGLGIILVAGFLLLLVSCCYAVDEQVAPARTTTTTTTTTMRTRTLAGPY
jgi:hypothetical protein